MQLVLNGEISKNDCWKISLIHIRREAIFYIQPLERLQRYMVIDFSRPCIKRSQSLLENIRQIKTGFTIIKLLNRRRQLAKFSSNRCELLLPYF